MSSEGLVHCEWAQTKVSFLAEERNSVEEEQNRWCYGELNTVEVYFVPSIKSL